MRLPWENHGYVYVTHISSFFQELSQECQQLKIMIRLLDELAFQASVRGRMLNDPPLLLILDQMEICALKARDFMDDLEILSQFGL